MTSLVGLTLEMYLYLLILQCGDSRSIIHPNTLDSLSLWNVANFPSFDIETMLDAKKDYGPENSFEVAIIESPVRISTALPKS